jgi:hypothetical protein
MLVQSALAFLVLASMAIAPPPANPPTPEDTLLELILKTADNPAANFECSRFTPLEGKPYFSCGPPLWMQYKLTHKQLDAIADRANAKLKPTNSIKSITSITNRYTKIYKQSKLTDAKGANFVMRGFFQDATVYVFCMGDGCDYQDQLSKEEQQKLTYGNYVDGTFPKDKAHVLYQKTRAKGYTEFFIMASDSKRAPTELPKTASLVAPVAWADAAALTRNDLKATSWSEARLEDKAAESIAALLSKPNITECKEAAVGKRSIFSCSIKEFADGVTNKQANSLALLVQDLLTPFKLVQILNTDKKLHQQSIFPVNGDQLLVQGMLPNASEYVFCVGDGCALQGTASKMTFANWEKKEFDNWKDSGKRLEKGFVIVTLKAKGAHGNPPNNAVVIASMS